MSNREIDPQDKKCFLDAMRGVTPLKHVPKVMQSAHPKILPKRQPEISVNLENLSSHCTEIVGPETVLAYCTNHCPLKRFSDLRKGKMKIEARLDLHGLRINEAEIQLQQFIKAQTVKNHQTVLIIHGKGGDKNNESPLKSHTAHWLKQLPILAFHSAQPKDGGNGALYVLLRRSC